jgi:O-antigen ligase
MNSQIQYSKSDSLRLLTTLPYSISIVLFIIVFGALSVGVDYFGAYLPILLIVGIVALRSFVLDARVRFALIVAMVLLMQFDPSPNGVSLVGYLGAIVFIGDLFLLLFRKKILLNAPLTNSALFVSFGCFIVWTLGIGVVRMFGGEVDYIVLVKDFLAFMPFFLLPACYMEIVEKHKNAEEFLVKCMLVLWIAVFVASAIKIRSSLLQAVYLFELGTSRYDTLNGGLMIFIFLSLAMVPSFKKKWFLYSGLLISVLSLILTFGRSVWLGTVLFIPIVVLLGNRSERKRGYSFIIKALCISLILLVLGYIFIPAVKIGLVFLGSKLFSASKLKTDASMYNRYVEWESLWKYITASPLAGYGFGGKYNAYNWLLGFTMHTGYSHNAYLSILFKSGIVGFILLMVPVVGFLVKGIKYAIDKNIPEKERAYLRAGVALMLNILLLGYTGNIFFSREMSMYIAFFWCYCMQIEYQYVHYRNSNIYPLKQLQ